MAGQIPSGEVGIGLETDLNLGQMFERHARAHPGALAVTDDDHAWSYGELATWSAHLAQHLEDVGLGVGTVVAVLLPVGAAHLGAVLAIVRSGRIYLSLDPGYPEARLRLMVESAGVGAFVTRRAEAGRARALASGPIIEVDDLPRTGAPLPVKGSPGPDAFAALYFTSGSTGLPKAVPHTHRNILFDALRQGRDLAITAQDRFDLLFSPSFSAFLSPVFGALMTGASVHVLDLRQHPVERLRDWWQERGITVATLGVSTFRRLIGVLPPGRNFPDLRLLCLGAEPLRPADVDHFRRLFGATAVLQNAYATTETRTIAQALWANDAAAPNPITMGRPVAGKPLRVIGPEGQPVGPGETGEIEVTSAYISPGPWEGGRPWPGGLRPKLEAVTWRTGDLGEWTAAGELVFHGRQDDQLKVRGHRVEAGEVESHLLAHPAVRDAAVLVAAPDLPADSPERLVALWVWQEGAALAWPDLRAYLRQALPVYAVPAEGIAVAELPRTATGKLARRELADAWRRARPTAVGNRRLPTPPGQRSSDLLADAWWRALNHVEGDETADFFSLGGDSLAAAELLAAASARVGETVPAAWLLAHPTLAEFRQRLKGATGGRPPEARRRYRLQAARIGPSPAPLYLFPPWNHSLVMFRDLATSVLGDRDIWAVEGRDEEGRAPAVTVEQMADRLVEHLRRFQPAGPVAVGGFSSGGYLAWEVAQRWSAVEQVHLLDCSRYHAALDASAQAKVGACRTWRGRLRVSAGVLARAQGAPRGPLVHRLLWGKMDWWLRGRWRRHRDDPYAVAFARNVAVNSSYAIAPLGVPVTLLRADTQGDWYNLVSPDLGWAPFCLAGLTVHPVASDHPGLLRPPAAEITRRWLQS